MLEEKVLLAYEGVVTYDIIVSIGDKIRDLVSRLSGPKLAKNVFACSNELLQNIHFYSEEKSILPDGRKAGSGKVSLFLKDELLIYRSESLINSFKFLDIRSRIEGYNYLSPEDLKMALKAKRQAAQERDSKGGGLGFIEIIRRSGNPIQVSATQKDGTYSIMTLQAIFNTKDSND